MAISSESVLLRRLALGAVLGALATKPMTLMMEYADSKKIDSRWSSLPPRKITQEALRRAGIKRFLTEKQHQQSTTASHYGFGATVGALYGAFTSSQTSRSPMLTASSFALAVWAVSYLGWLPMINSRASANHQSFWNNAAMFWAHIVWGMSLGAMDKVQRYLWHASCELSQDDRKRRQAIDSLDNKDVLL